MSFAFLCFAKNAKFFRLILFEKMVKFCEIFNELRDLEKFAFLRNMHFQSMGYVSQYLFKCLDSVPEVILPRD